MRLLTVCLSLMLAACHVEPPGPSEEAAPDGSSEHRAAQDVQAAIAALPAVEVLGAHEDGVPFMIRGRLGSAGASLQGLSAHGAHTRVATSLAAVAPVFRLKASDLIVRQLSLDEQGHTHIRYDQTHNGLPVVGEELILHVDPAGTIYAANGSAHGGELLPVRPRISAKASCSVALEHTPGGVQAAEDPRLVYVRSVEDGRLKLAFEVLVTGEDMGTPIQDHVFVDALDGAIVERDSDIQTARSRKVYSANNGSTLPGTLRCTETACNTTDSAVNSAFANLGAFYDCFSANFSRDSFDNAGASLIASVHYSNNYVNAYYNGSQIVCGDGDGTTPYLCSEPDVVIHEFTHAIVSRSSNLTYSGEPGALNEALSDIFAGYCEGWALNWVINNDVWCINEGLYPPGTPLYCMSNPAASGAADYYPERGSSNEVHKNSGIAGLAFYLLSVGGTHPRGKTAVNVTGIGLGNAGRIFYKANNDLFTASTTFAQARTYTEQAAVALGYSAAIVAEVSKAWEAVGVTVSTPPSATPLSNGVAKTNLSGASGSQSYFYLDVPAGLQVKFTTSGGTGDVDLYVKRGSLPTTSSYDCRPYLSGNTESCTLTAQPGAVRYYVMLWGYSAYSGVSLMGQYDGVAPTVSVTAPSNGATVSGTVSITATASDNLAVDRVSFYVGSTLIGTVRTPPYSITWDTTPYAGGTHSLSAKAYDAAGNQGTSPLVTVTVADITPPTTTITSPAANAIVQGNVTITASAADNVGVTRVDFYVNSTFIGSSSAPYQIIWNTSGWSNGSYSLSAKAYDAASNSGSSSAVPVALACNSTAQFLVNGDFDSGSSPFWIESHPQIINRNTFPLPDGTSNAPHSGQYKASLGGAASDVSNRMRSIYQDVTLPSSVCGGVLSFFMRVGTLDTNANDLLVVTLRSASGTVLQSQIYSNLEQGAADYKQVTLTLGPQVLNYKGQPVRIHFESQEDGANETTFFIDDTALHITQ